MMFWIFVFMLMIIPAFFMWGIIRGERIRITSVVGLLVPVFMMAIILPNIISSIQTSPEYNTSSMYTLFGGGQQVNIIPPENYVVTYTDTHSQTIDPFSSKTYLQQKQ